MLLEKSVMLSVQPEHCINIVKGIKTLELRKTKPRIEPPFTCYVYETKQPVKVYNGYDYVISSYGGYVIGEFVCNDIDKVAVYNDVLYSEKNSQANKLKQLCLSIEDVKKYLGKKNLGYIWHISNFKRYAVPKNLWEFNRFLPCEENRQKCGMNYFNDLDWTCQYCAGEHLLLKAPQSWQYVKNLWSE